MLWTLLSPSLKGEHSWIWTPCGKFWMTLYPLTQDKLLAALRFCCEVSRALGPAQHCFIMTVLSYEIQSLPGIQTTLPEKLKLSPLDGRRNTLQRTRKKWGVRKKKDPIFPPIWHPKANSLNILCQNYVLFFCFSSSPSSHYQPKGEFLTGSAHIYFPFNSETAIVQWSCTAHSPLP